MSGEKSAAAGSNQWSRTGHMGKARSSCEWVYRRGSTTGDGATSYRVDIIIWLFSNGEGIIVLSLTTPQISAFDENSGICFIQRSSSRAEQCSGSYGPNARYTVTLDGMKG